MLNLSDNELDRLSREAAERHEAAQHPDAWNKMEKLLDKELGRPSPVQRIMKPRRFLYYPAALILVTGIYFILKPLNHTSTSTLQKISPASQPVTPISGNTAVRDGRDNPAVKPLPVNPAKQHAIEQADSNHKAQEDVAPAGATTKKTISNENSDRPPNARAAKPAFFSADKNARQIVPSHQQNAVATNSKNSGRDQTKHDALIENPVLSGPLLIAGNKKDQSVNGQKNNNDAQSKGGNNGKEQPGRDQPVILKTYGQDDEVKRSVVSSIQPAAFFPAHAFRDGLDRPRVQKNSLIKDAGFSGRDGGSRTLSLDRSLQIGLVVSPDVSSVSSDYASKVGSNIGLTLGYSLSSRFSINTGLILTRKFYTSTGREFHAPPNFWTNMVRLDFVKGNCRMLEIPLNIRYDFRDAGKIVFFVSTGLSSYIMQKENYQFYYHDNYTSFGRIQNSDYHTSRQYWLSVLNLSAGFETKISNSFSLQAEPYLKLPLTGIGFGKVQLNSYGMNLSLKFNPVLKRKRR